ncbi:Ohr subfamily peroxiredoxin [Ancylobacter sp. 3268]|uniref:organic hydroperoxide resistance protein n=1 Tax=Ancylobacter sp. 3268 TaxID=2817752 RepID=UPI00285B8B6C|nr:organic hydroperoxide resistance protein [Ancylobacter sp. 3268]MDR6955609.1 Ohr subfamily peroxiredoxin [Ancylobacter sp. 3268]
MNSQSKLLYTARVRTTGGREGGTSRSSDGNLDLRISPPGGHGTGTNPEQLFAAGWSTCFESAIGIAARKAKVALPPGLFIDAEVDLSLVDGFYTLSARLDVHLPGVPRDVAQALVDEAHTLCPYSRATHGNIRVATTVTV